MKMRLPNSVKTVIDGLEQNGFCGYLVGGCVRDFLMGIEQHDYDLTTDALPEQIKACFDDRRVIETGIQHGTVTVIVDGEHIEVTTFRIDGDYTDNRHPTNVSFTPNLQEDLARRDFTVNAMAYGKEGLQDFFGGQKDLRDKVIRCVGDPDRRFDEDALRILRAMRFASTLGFEIEENTARAIFEKEHLLENISFERKRDELGKLLCGRDAMRILLQFRRVVEGVIPELTADKGAIDRRIRQLESLPQLVRLRLAALLSPLGADIAVDVLSRFKTDNLTKRRICAAIEEQNTPLQTRAEVHRLIYRVGFDAATDVAWLQGNAAARNMILQAKENEAPVSLRQLAVNGEDLTNIGVPKGREVGELLEKLLLQVIDGTLPNEREALLNWVEKNL